MSKDLSMIEKFIWEKLTANTPLTLVFIGAVLLVTGAGGCWPSPSLQVNDVGWRVILGVMGVMIVGIGGLLIWREKAVRSQVAESRL